MGADYYLVKEKTVDLLSKIKKMITQCIEYRAVQRFVNSFVVNQSLVLRINICGENRHLRKAEKRWWQC
jgi:hypothetical protein